MIKLNGEFFTMPVKCGSLLCRRGCATKKVEREILWAYEVLPRHEKLWVGHATFDAQLATRLRKRARTSEGTLRVRREDGVVYVLSTFDSH